MFLQTTKQQFMVMRRLLLVVLLALFDLTASNARAATPAVPGGAGRDIIPGAGLLHDGSLYRNFRDHRATVRGRVWTS